MSLHLSKCQIVGNLMLRLIYHLFVLALQHLRDPIDQLEYRTCAWRLDLVAIAENISDCCSGLEILELKKTNILVVYLKRRYMSHDM